ncbi:MAG: hypothetical protein AMJ78_10300 [Omnitrophica WOR_2 bacterium SM23_29]|nr:MAG: hypothetical protein AMJ78_10300 [Omnitrophica WOR_2 bacterium SM23_29]
MAGFLKKLSLVPAGLRYKLMVAFALMSIIPLSICVYLATNYIFWSASSILDVSILDTSIVITIAIAISMLGFKIARDIVSPIVDMAIKAKVIAKGDLSREIEVRGEDEIGELGTTLNILSRRIKENMDELKSYGERTKEINMEISKKVLVLSNLLQIGNLISQGSPLEDILNVIIDKLAQIDEGNTTFLMLIEDRDSLTMNANYNLRKEGLKALKLRVGVGLLGNAISDVKTLVLDRRSRPTKDSSAFLETFELKNCVLTPVVAHGKIIGLLCLGNDIPDYEFREDNVELLKLFSKQVAIAIENDALTRRTRELAIRDELTGLYNERFIRNRLGEEIKRAVLYHRPCSFVIFNIDDFKIYHGINGELAVEEAIEKIGKAIESNVTEIDRVGRLSGDEFAVVLPEKNKKQANSSAEALRQRIEALGIIGGEGYPRQFLTVSGGVSENPIDGATAEDLIKRAKASLSEAKLRGKNTVVS